MSHPRSPHVPAARSLRAVTTAVLCVTVASAQEPRTLTVGDSWALLTAPELQEAFDYFGHADKRVVNSGVAGTTAEDWAAPGMLAEITATLDAEPTIDTVHLNVGGNDLIRSWSTTLPVSEQEALLDAIAADVETIVDHLLDLREDVQIVIAGYDYLNFVETVAADPTGACAIAWTLLGSPTALELNDAFVGMEERKAALADGEPRVSHLESFGLMQQHFGYPGLDIPPFSPQLPDGTLPSPPEAMGSDGTDCIHLSESGYEILSEHAYELAYDGLFTPPGSPRLLPPDPGIAGLRNTLVAIDLPPGGKVRFLRGNAPGLTPVGPCPGLTLDMTSPKLLGEAVADATGRAELEADVPAVVSGREVWLQAAESAGCESTNAVVWTFE